MRGEYGRELGLEYCGSQPGVDTLDTWWRESIIEGTPDTVNPRSFTAASLPGWVTEQCNNNVIDRCTEYLTMVVVELWGYRYTFDVLS